MEKFKITIKVRKHEPLTIDESDLIQLCWQNIIEIEERNPKTLDDFTQPSPFSSVGDCMDDLMQNYFTLKMVYKEYNLDITDEMANIEDCILKYQKRLFKAMELEDLNNLPPAFSITEN